MDISEQEILETASYQFQITNKTLLKHVLKCIDDKNSDFNSKEGELIYIRKNKTCSIYDGKNLNQVGGLIDLKTFGYRNPIQKNYNPIQIQSQYYIPPISVESVSLNLNPIISEDTQLSYLYLPSNADTKSINLSCTNSKWYTIDNNILKCTKTYSSSDKNRRTEVTVVVTDENKNTVFDRKSTQFVYCDFYKEFNEKENIVISNEGVLTCYFSEGISALTPGSLKLTCETEDACTIKNNNNGTFNILPNKEGSFKFTLTCDYKGHKMSITKSVILQIEGITEITITTEEIKDTGKIEYTVIPDAYKDSVKFVPIDNELITMDENGVVKYVKCMATDPVGAATVTISAYALDDSGVKTTKEIRFKNTHVDDYFIAAEKHGDGSGRGGWFNATPSSSSNHLRLVSNNLYLEKDITIDTGDFLNNMSTTSNGQTNIIGGCNFGSYSPTGNATCIFTDNWYYQINKYFININNITFIIKNNLPGRNININEKIFNNCIFNNIYYFGRSKIMFNKCGFNNCEFSDFTFTEDNDQHTAIRFNNKNSTVTNCRFTNIYGGNNLYCIWFDVKRDNNGKITNVTGCTFKDINGGYMVNKSYYLSSMPTCEFLSNEFSIICNTAS